MSNWRRTGPVESEMKLTGGRLDTGNRELPNVSKTASLVASRNTSLTELARPGLSLIELVSCEERTTEMILSAAEGCTMDGVVKRTESVPEDKTMFSVIKVDGST